MTRREIYIRKKAAQKRRRSIYLTLIALVGLIVLNLAFFSHADSQEMQYKEICVQDGDTLWSIAASNNIMDKDVRKLIDEIKKANGLTSSSLSIGETVKVPIS